MNLVRHESLQQSESLSLFDMPRGLLSANLTIPAKLDDFRAVFRRLGNRSVAPLAPLVLLEHGPSMKAEASFTAKSLSHPPIAHKFRVGHQCTRSGFVTPRTASG